MKAAQDERIKVLTRLVDVAKAPCKVGAGGEAELFSAEQELCNAQLDSTDDPEKRIALLTKLLEQANAVLADTQRRFDTGKALESDVLRAKSVSLGVKIRLLREQN